MTNRVVITGYGVTSPIGSTAETFWNALKAGKSGIAQITKFDTTEFGVHNAAEVKDFPFDKYFQKKDAKRMDLFSLFGIYAALEALAMSGVDTDKVNKERFGVIVGSGIGGLQTIQEQVGRLVTKGPRRVQPLFVPMSIVNMAAGNIAMRVGAEGICTCVTTACASATNSIGEAFRNIKHGYSDIILAGGAEASITEIGIAGFNSLTALSTTEDPARASIPFDKDRNGFVMGEGAGILVLESLAHAQARGATILGEVVGYGSNCDAYHMTSPRPDGSGAKKAMALALEEAGIEPNQVGYVNAHGTSTQANEKGESQAIVELFGKDTPVSSTKSMTGHLLGGAGGVEAIATLEAIRQDFIPVTAGTKELGEDIEANVIYGQGQAAHFDYAISNTFGFGGHNAVIALKRWTAKD